MSELHVVFMGTSAFAVPVLRRVQSLCAKVGWSVVAVYTSPARPAGRGRGIQESPVQAHATAAGIPVLTPPRLTREEAGQFEALAVDLVVLAAYGLLLPRAFLFTPRFGALNVHPSLLPRHRGATPVQGAILAGDGVTGTSIIVMDEGLDTGPIVAQSTVELRGDERTPELTRRLFDLGANLLTELLPTYVNGELTPTPQADGGATVTRRLSKVDGVVDWTQTAVQIERQVRAFDPWPSSATTWGGRRLEVLEARVDTRPTGEPPGTVVQRGGEVGVASGEGTLVLHRVKREGGAAVAVADFVLGHGAFVGARLPC